MVSLEKPSVLKNRGRTLTSLSSEIVNPKYSIIQRMAEASLIPKKLPSASQRLGAGVGIFFRIGFVFFVVALLATGGLFAYRMLLLSNLTKQREALQQLESQFPVADIERREEVARAIEISKALLDAHVRPSRIFPLLQENTLPAVFFSTFSYAETGRVITVSGDAPSYQAVAQQASIFESLEEVTSATFSNLSLTSRGTVNFNLKIVL